MVMCSGEDELHMNLELFLVVLALRKCFFSAQVTCQDGCKIQRTTFLLCLNASFPELRSGVSSVEAKHGAKSLVLFTVVVLLPTCFESLFLLLMLRMKKVIFPAGL